jgi:hypothetical protein
MEDDLWVLAAALDSGYVPYTELIDWAQRQVLEIEAPSNWLLDLCVSKSQEDAIGLLLLESDRQADKLGHEQDHRGSHDDLYLGFLYLRFERGDLSLPELLLHAGKYADSSGCDIDCETFYLMFNEINGRGPTRRTQTPVSERVARLLAPKAALARSQVEKLPVCCH